jgi:hypothetical protein
MSEGGVDEWTVERERERSYEVSSQKGTVVANRVESSDSSQTWIVDANIEGIKPMSWKVQVDDDTEVVNQVIPALLNEQIPEMSISRSN